MPVLQYHSARIFYTTVWYIVFQLYAWPMVINIGNGRTRADETVWHAKAFGGWWKEGLNYVPITCSRSQLKSTYIVNSMKIPTLAKCFRSMRKFCNVTICWIACWFYLNGVCVDFQRARFIYAIKGNRMTGLDVLSHRCYKLLQVDWGSTSDIPVN